MREATGRRIDRLVYELYGLTEEENRDRRGERGSRRRHCASASSVVLMSASIRAPYVPYVFEMAPSLIADPVKIGKAAARYSV